MAHANLTPHPSTEHAALRWFPFSGGLQAIIVLLTCVFSRTATTIRHIEDADSLRFALGVLDFDVTKLQPQFPGYAAFMGVVKLLDGLLGSYALAFSVVGGLATFVLIHYALAILRWRFASPSGLVLSGLILFNPMVWLLGNRYMSDLSGAACMLAAFYQLSRAESPRHLLAGFFLTGILAGWRLSYAPFLIPPLAAALWAARTDRRAIVTMLVSGAAGVLIWLIPLILDTGWSTLLATARGQTDAHFNATGGTYVTESAWPLRLARTVSHLWVDGLGAWAPGRHAATSVVACGAALFLTVGLRRGRTGLANHGVVAERGGPNDAAARARRLLVVSAATYVVWILLFQNVIHQTRHVLPLVPPLLMLLATGLAVTTSPPSRAKTIAPRIFAAVFLIAYAFVGTALAVQHTRPAAIAQAKAYVETFADSSTVIVAAPWVEKFLSAQGVRARFLSVETPAELAALPARLRALPPATRLAAVGDYRDVMTEAALGRTVASRRTFHHNPYVNRLGARIEVFTYGPASRAPAEAAP